MATTEQICQKLSEILGIPFEEVDSSNLLCQGYEPNKGILYLVFRSKNPAKTPEWVYQYKVNSIVYNNFLKADSKGRFFASTIQPYGICKSPMPKL